MAFHSDNQQERRTKIHNNKNRKTEAHSVYDLPNLEALVRYMHAAAGFTVKSTWLKAIKNGNFESWPGLTYKNAENIAHIQLRL